MTPEEAIEILSDPRYQSYSTVKVGFPAALRLGIEALKLIQAYRKWLEANLCCGLPGETKGEENETT